MRIKGDVKNPEIVYDMAESWCDQMDGGKIPIERQVINMTKLHITR